MSTPTLAFKSAALVGDEGTQVLDATDEGIVTAVVSVTGVVDEVDDIILPGAYTETLSKRTPKVCWHHSWEQPIGRVLAIEELMPGDSRLPKLTRDGKAWPREAGALIATMQINMKSDRCREAYEAIRFYSESGECEYSIGYKVQPGKSTRDSKGVRRIKAMDLFELSFVLFGAHTMTGTLALKAAVQVMHEVKSADGGLVELSRKAVEETFERLMSEVDLDNPDEDELVDEPAEPAAVVGDEQEVLLIEDDEDELADAVKAWIDGKGGLPSDADTGIEAVCPGCQDTVVFDTMNGWMRKDGSYSHDDASTHSDHMDPPAQFKAEGGADRNRGGAEKLRRWYVHGEGAARIGWGTPGDFDRCVAIASEHMTPEQAKGYCNLRHQDAVGAPPGHGHPGAKALTGTPDTTAPDSDTDPTQDPKRTGVMVAVYPDEATAKKIAVPGGEDPEELHVTLAFLGDVSDDAGEGLDLQAASGKIVAACQVAAATYKPLSGIVAGLGRFPDNGSGVPIWAPVDVVDLGAVREAVVDALKAAGLPVKDDHGFTPHMTLGYNLDDRLIQPVDDVPVEFTHLVVAVGGAHTRIPLGEDVGAEASGAPIAGAPMGGEIAEGEPAVKGYDPTLETGPHAGNRPPGSLNGVNFESAGGSGVVMGKSYPRLTGTMEERQRAIEDALTAALLGDLDEDDRSKRHISVTGTYPDRVICTLVHWNGGGDESNSYEFPYVVNRDGTVSLGEPTPVRLTLTATVDGEDLDADIPVGDLLPLAEMIHTVSGGLRSLDVAEVKAGRVLSASNAQGLKTAVEHLIRVLDAAGIKITADPDDDGSTAAVDTETTAPSARGKSADAPTGDVVEIPVGDVAALLADIETLTA
jgi:2'-5' RNA ligase